MPPHSSGALPPRRTISVWGSPISSATGASFPPAASSSRAPTRPDPPLVERPRRDRDGVPALGRRADLRARSGVKTLACALVAAGCLAGAASATAPYIAQGKPIRAYASVRPTVALFGDSV